NLGTALPTITHNININGPGASQLTVQRSLLSGTAEFRVFDISTSNVLLAGLTISNGKLSSSPFIGVGGGAVRNDRGVVTISRSLISSNSAPGGGGVYNRLGSLTITDSQLEGNSSVGGSAGGAILSEGALSTAFLVGNSTLANNTASGSGAGIAISSANGFTTSPFIVNTTISGNAATGSGGGLVVASVPVVLVNGAVT